MGCGLVIGWVLGGERSPYRSEIVKLATGVSWGGELKSGCGFALFASGNELSEFTLYH